ncbi:hypothetical protein GQ54DRAFT_299780 [Martensiomyces pterosporus]|nr:hypothetical protein GQ54DRAFT_299780 [Martensiomyces pterosporus]
MQSLRALARPSSGIARALPRTAAARTQAAAIASRAFVRFNSTEAAVPKSLLPTAEARSSSVVSTNVGDLDYTAVPSSVRSDVWALYVSTMERLVASDNRKPKKTALHWLIMNAQTTEELDVALDLSAEWRMQMMPITQATTQIWVDACIRLDYPELFMKILLDRWKYRQLPISYNLARFIRFLGHKATEAHALATKKAASGEEGSEEMAAKATELLDDAFRVFALYQYYGIEYDAQAYGALVEACCEVNTDEAWRRALVASEETLASQSPLITLEALKALESRSNEHGEAEMAQRYKDLVGTLNLKPASKKSVEFDSEGDVIVKDQN